MLAHAQSEYPNECCGILGGIVDADQRILHVRKHYRLVNEAASPVEYYAVRSLLEADKDMRACDYEMVAVYHSHPTSAPIPSRTDLQRSEYYTHVIHFIIGLQEPTPVMRGWWLSPSEYQEAMWKIV
jgi:proteasome lid subunit RPN8/RPN11